MASFRKRNDKWQARVHRKGCAPEVKTFHSKADATKWARNVEAQLDLGVLAAKKTLPQFKTLIQRYVKEVTTLKKGRIQEGYRASQIQNMKFTSLTLDQVSCEVIAQFRDDRLKAVSRNTVRLELAFISAVFEQCRKEWGFAVSNPVRQIRIPKPGKSRQRRLEAGEEEALLAACKLSGANYLHSFVVLALETAMRFGELARVTWPAVNLGKRTIFIADTKNGTTRTVPLSTNALKAIQAIPRSINGQMFISKPGSIRSAFLIAVKKAQADAQCHSDLLNGLRFHDLRHEAVSRLFEKGLNPLEVGFISGHKTMAMLQRYTHLRAENIAIKLG